VARKDPPHAAQKGLQPLRGQAAGRQQTAFGDHLVVMNGDTLRADNPGDGQSIMTMASCGSATGEMAAVDAKATPVMKLASSEAIDPALATSDGRRAARADAADEPRSRFRARARDEGVHQRRLRPGGAERAGADA
jgi:hypothetical protein